MQMSGFDERLIVKTYEALRKYFGRGASANERVRGSNLGAEAARFKRTSLGGLVGLGPA